MDNLFYMLIEFEAQDINITHYPAISFSPMSAWLWLEGQIFDIKRNYGEEIQSLYSFEDEDISLQKVAILQHDFFADTGARSGSGTFYVPPGDVEKMALNFKVQPIRKGTFSGIIVIGISGSVIYDEFERAFKKTAMKNKCIGGDIKHLNVDCVENLEEVYTKLHRYIQKNPFWAYYMRNDLIKKKISEGYTPAESLCFATQPYYKDPFLSDQKNDKNNIAKEKGFLFPTLIGYQLLENPKKRSGTRFQSDGYLHAFAEPVFSTFQLSTFNLKSSLSDYFLSFSYENESKTFSIIET